MMNNKNNKDNQNVFFYSIYQYLKKDKWLIISLLLLSYGFYLKTIQIPKNINSLFIHIKNNNQNKIITNFQSLLGLIFIIFILLSLYDWLRKKIEKNSHIYFMKYFNDKIINTLEHNYLRKTDAVYYINQTMFSHRIQYLFLHILEVLPFFIVVISILSFIFTKNVPYTILIFIIGTIICIWLYYLQIKKSIRLTKKSLTARDNIIHELQDINNNKYTIYSFDKYNQYSFLNKQQNYFKYYNTLFYQNDLKSFYIIWISYFIMFGIIIYLYYQHKQNLIDIILIALLFLGSEVIKRIWHFNSAFLIIGELSHYQSQLKKYIKEKQKENKDNLHKHKIYQIRSIPNQNIILQIKHLYYTYPNQIDKYILKDINLEFEKGKVYSITGKNGCGKSTLLKLIYGLYHPSNGNIIINRKYINQINNNNNKLLEKVLTKDNNNTIIIKNIKEWRKYIHYREQYPHLFDDNIYQNLVYGNNDINKTKYHLQKYHHLFKDIIKKENSKVSGGQKQIISLFRLLNYDKPIILLDEPTSALDKDTKHIFFEILDTLKQNGSTIIIVTHDKQVLNKSDNIINLSK